MQLFVVKEYMDNMYATQAIYHSQKLKICNTMVRSECPPEDHMFEELVRDGGTLGGCCRSFQRSSWLSEVRWGFSFLILQDAFWGAQQVPSTSTVGGVICSCHHNWNPPLGTPFTKMDCTPMKLCVRLCVSFLKGLLSGIFS